MRLYDIIWKDKFIEKIADKHAVSTVEVEEIIFSQPHARLFEKGHVKGEDIYAVYGQTNAGRYLIVFFIHKSQFAALPISARDMTTTERRYYEKHAKAD